MYNLNMNKKLNISLVILLLLVVCITFLWKQALLVSILFALIAYTKHKLIPIKKELLWFSLISVGGGTTEILLVNLSHAWSYANAQFFNIPIYMPIFWGVLGTTLIVLYDSLIKE